MQSQFDPRENTGTDFSETKLLDAQGLSWKAIDLVSREIMPGMTEDDAKSILKRTLKELGAAPKSWHPPQIRFGKNTTLAFGKPGDKSVILKNDDLYFLDIGPVFFGHEGDAGRTICVGNDPELRRLVDDSKLVFEKTRERWKQTGETGQSLYEFAKEFASGRGWILSLTGASGHRVADFPHAIHHRGQLKTFDGVPTPNRWILEIHLLHPNKDVGAFFEDVL